jgi:hypothetical protein
MSLINRVEKLEQGQDVGNEGGVCRCAPGGFEVRSYPSPDSTAKARADPRPPPQCDTCGGEKQVIKVVRVERPILE